jgi:hypothetical protein
MIYRLLFIKGNRIYYPKEVVKMKTYCCTKIKSDLEINGDIEKPEWKDALGVHLVETAEGTVPKQKTVAKMLWSDNYLYISYHCEDSFINATLTGYNDLLYDEEVVEAFIDDNSDLKTYIEINLNPLNALLHYSIFNNLKGYSSSYARVGKKIITAIRRNDEEGFWDAEIAVPLAEFITAPNIPPKDGDKWRINLYRIDRPKDGEDEYSAWSPTGKIAYHIPDKFGEITFKEDI